MSAHALGNWPHRARHDLRVDALRRELRQEHVELAVAHERFAADDRQLHRAMTRDEIEHAVDERLALEVGQLPQHDAAAEMIVAVGVAAGTA